MNLATARPLGDGRLATAVLFLPPALVLFTLFVVAPIGEAAWYSGYSWNGFGVPGTGSAWRTTSR